MNFYRPRSIFGLSLLGFIVVAIPLMAAVAQAVVYLDKLAEQSEGLIKQGMALERESKLLPELLNDMERNARQYQVLGDTTLLKLYRERDARFHSRLDALEQFAPPDELREQLSTLRTVAGKVMETLGGQPLIDEKLAEPPASGQIALVLNLFVQLEVASAAANRISRDAIDDELTRLQENVVDARQRLIAIAAGLIPVSVLLVLYFSNLIARPIRKLGLAIRNLGKGSMDAPIETGGPPDLRELGKELDWLRQQLREVDEQKNSFLHHVSHELKTPLASILEGTNLLQEGKLGSLNQTQTEVLGILKSSGVNLQTQIENLLKFNSLQQSHTQLDICSFDFESIAKQVLGEHRAATLSKQIKIILRLTPVELVADQGRTRTALDNLVSNAVKFSPRTGKIRITAKVQGSTLVVDVEDQGPGVAADERDKIFKAFYQGRLHERGPVRGSGIGLAVAQTCMEAQGGTLLALEKAAGAHGAHFRLSLPLRVHEIH